MLRTFTHAVVALAVTSTVIAGPLDQDPHPLYGDAPDTPTVSATADDWLKIGLARYEAGDFKGAIDAFLTGNDLDPRPAFLFAIAQAERRRGDCAAAIVYYERFLASSPPESQAAAARDQRDRCEHAVGSTPVAEPTPPAPTVVIAALPAAPAPARHAGPPWWQDRIADSLAGGAIALSAIGVALIASANGLADDAAAASTYDDHAALRDRAISWHAAGLVTLSAGLVAGAAAAIVWWKPWRDRPLEVRPGPGAGVALAGVVMRALVVSLALAAAGCIEVPPFVCETDAACGAGGACEEDHACSFADEACHAGRRYGELGDEALAGTCVGDLSGAIVALAAGSDHACARAGDGRVWCWGDNQEGALGRTDVADSGSPTPIPDLGGVTDLDAGEYHTCAVSAGEVVCWGMGERGELGDGTNESRAAAAPVRELTGVVEVDLGEEHSCARDGDGAVWCWGDNRDRETGAPGNPAITAPMLVALDAPATAIAAGGQTTCAITGASTWCWGKNDHGQLATGDDGQHNRPVEVPAFAGAAQIVIGGEHTCALDADGAVRCAGLNDRGQLGDGTTSDRAAPVDVAGLADVVELAALDWTTCARDAAGDVRCWGDNELGELGDGTEDATRLAPGDRVALPGRAISLTGGEHHACAQTEDGCVWCWGADTHGQLGAGADRAGGLRPARLSWLLTQANPRVRLG